MFYNKGKVSLIVFPSNQADSYLITFCRIYHNMNAHTIVHLINDVEPTVTPMLMQAVCLDVNLVIKRFVTHHKTNTDTQKKH